MAQQQPATVGVEDVQPEHWLDVASSIRQELTRRDVAIVDWVALPGPQTQALVSEADEVLYGGAAGGGKSDLLLGLARTRHRSSVIFRRTYPQLEDSVIPRSLEIYGDPGRLNRARKQWEFHDGRLVRFRHLERDDDVFGHQSAQYDLVAFDELTQFTEAQYVYLTSRARSVRPGQRVRIVGASNPGGEGNDWVMRRWAAWLDRDHPRPAAAGELRWFRRDGEGLEVETAAGDPDARSRTFIPARLADNPHLGDEYRRVLDAMPEPWRSQLLEGDWQIGLVDEAYQVIPSAWIDAAMRRWRPEGHGGAPGVALGVDVARGGACRTVLAPRRGDWVGQMEVYDGRLTPDGQSVVALLAPWVEAGYRAQIDGVGVGASAIDLARGLGMDVVGLVGSERSEHGDKSGSFPFGNLKSEMWWRLREALDPAGGRNLALPMDADLRSELRAPRYEMQTNGLKLESKDRTEQRVGRSPDRADAVVYAVYEPSPAGEPLFPMVGARHQAQAQPEIYQRGRSWWVRYPAQTVEEELEGRLMRAIWHSRRGGSAALWVHEDVEGCWTVFRCLERSGGALAEFMRAVDDLSRDGGVSHNYEVDVFSALEAFRAERSFAVEESLWDAGRSLAGPCPVFVQPGVIARSAGLDLLDGRLLATLAIFPGDAYWRGRVEESAGYESPRILVVWPREVLQALREARHRKTAWTADAGEDESLTAIGGGGPLVRCLRLLAVEAS